MHASLEKHPIVFYNVENLFDTFDDIRIHNDEEFTPDGDKFWDHERYYTKLTLLSEALLMPTGETPLAFGMTEIENRRVLEDLIKQPLLKDVDYRIVHFDSEDRRGIDTAFIYDAAFLKTKIETKLHVEIEDEPSFRTRYILYIFGEIEGSDIHFFVNHWPSRREGTSKSSYRREAAATILRKQIDGILNQNSKANILILGDFNDTPGDYSLYEILRAKGQHEQLKGDLINLLIEEHYKGYGTVVHDRNWFLFDQLISSQGIFQGKNGLQINQNNAFILQNDDLLITFPNGNQKPNATYRGDNYEGGHSDHLPVFLTLKNAK